MGCSIQQYSYIFFIFLIIYAPTFFGFSQKEPSLRINTIYTVPENDHALIIHGFSDLLVVQNEKDTMLECELDNASIFNEFTLQWIGKQPNIPIGSSSERVFTDFVMDKGTKKIRGVLHFLPIMHNDEGNYTCQANLGVMTLRKVVNIRVKEEPRFKVNGTVGGIVGQSLTVDCAADGLSKASYITILDEHGQTINESMGFLVTGTELTIKNLSEAHQNTKIVCLAVQNEMINETYSQTATYRNEITLNVWYPPKFLYGELKRYAINGRNFTILCNVLKSSPPVEKLIIRKDGDIVGEDSQHLYFNRGLNSKLLKIIDLDDNAYGQYTCEAYNGKLSSKQVIYLSKAMLPKQPKVQFLSVTNHSVTFKIIDMGDIEEGFLPVHSYKISYWPSSNVMMSDMDEVPKVLQDLPKSSSSIYKISFLDSFTAYDFTFIARNDVGEGDPITQKVTTGSQNDQTSSAKGHWPLSLTILFSLHFCIYQMITFF